MSNASNKIFRQLSADKKKTGLMIGLLCVGMLLWGRLLLNKQVPRTAVAEPTPMAAAAPPTEGAPAPGDGIRRVVKVDLADVLTRDLFVIDPSYYTRVPGTSVEIMPAKSEVKWVDEGGAASAIRQAAGSLTLQSTMLGDQPRALINGQLLGLNKVIAGFEIKRIEARYVILERDGVQIRLDM